MHPAANAFGATITGTCQQQPQVRSCGEICMASWSPTGSGSKHMQHVCLGSCCGILGTEMTTPRLINVSRLWTWFGQPWWTPSPLWCGSQLTRTRTVGWGSPLLAITGNLDNASTWTKYITNFGPALARKMLPEKMIVWRPCTSLHGGATTTPQQ